MRKRHSVDGETVPTVETSATLEAATLMCEYMKRENLDAGVVGSYSKAFNALVEAGKITPLPYESADQFLANHQELLPNAVPPLIASQQAKAVGTADFVAKTQAASARARSTTVVDYEDEHTGYPAAPTKYSFKRLLDSLSADEYRRRVSEEPQFAPDIDKRLFVGRCFSQ